MPKNKNKKTNNRKNYHKNAKMQEQNKDAVNKSDPTIASVDETNKEKDFLLGSDCTEQKTIELTKNIKEKDNNESKQEKAVLDIEEKLDNLVISENTEETKNVKETLETLGNCENAHNVPSNSDLDLSTRPADSVDTNITEPLVTSESNKIVENDSDQTITKNEKIEENNLQNDSKSSNEKEATITANDGNAIEEPLDIKKNTENKPVETHSDESESCKTNTTVAKIPEKTNNSSDKLIKLKYEYETDQWSPINTTGKRVYVRDFLMKLQNDPSSKIKPDLPNLDIILKNITKQKLEPDLRYKTANYARHKDLFPTFAKNKVNTEMVSFIIFLTYSYNIIFNNLFLFNIVHHFKQKQL